MRIHKRRAVIMVAAAAVIFSLAHRAFPSMFDVDAGVLSVLSRFGDSAPDAVAQWQPVPANYPTSGSWEQMLASSGR